MSITRSMRILMNQHPMFPDEGRVPHISLVFREMWDTTAPSL